MAEESKEHLLHVMMPFAVATVLADWEESGNHHCPDDVIICLECDGRRNGCVTCGDHGEITRREAYASYIAAHGDILLYPSKKRGETAKVFTITAEALAMMSLQPGGVEFMGMKFGDVSGGQFDDRDIRKTEKTYRRIRKVR